MRKLIKKKSWTRTRTRARKRQESKRKYCTKQSMQNEMKFSSYPANRGPKKSFHDMKVMKKMEWKKEKFQ